MAAQKPEDCDYLIAEYINSGNVQAAVDLYEPTATFVAEPGKPVSGHAAIREVMAGFVASKPRIEMKVPIVVQSGDLALTVSEYTITSTGPDGNRPPSPLVGRGSAPAGRRHVRFVIDNPTGTQAADAPVTAPPDGVALEA